MKCTCKPWCRNEATVKMKVKFPNGTGFTTRMICSESAGVLLDDLRDAERRAKDKPAASPDREAH